MSRKLTLIVETSNQAGRFQHKAYEKGVDNSQGELVVSNEVLRLYEQANEKLWEQLPKGAKGLNLRVEYSID